MAASDTLDIEFTNISAQPLGGPGRYIDRPDFAHGGAGVAACWYGGARGVARTLLTAAAERDIGPHAKAHLGAVDIAMHTALSALDAADLSLLLFGEHHVQRCRSPARTSVSAENRSYPSVTISRRCDPTVSWMTNWPGAELVLRSPSIVTSALAGWTRSVTDP
jgi:hypothetical protein